MPFLRAALIKKKASPEPEVVVEPVQEVVPEVVESAGVEAGHEESVPEVVDSEPEQEESPDIEDIAESESENVEPEAENEPEQEDLPDVEDVAESEPETEDESAQEELAEVGNANESPEAPIDTEQAEQEDLSDIEDIAEIEPENVEPEAEGESEQEDLPEVEDEVDSSDALIDTEQQDLPETEDITEPTETDTTSNSEPEAVPELPPEILEAVAESSPPEPEPAPAPEPSKPNKDYSGETLNYDFTSGERYVDTVSTKTEFDKMLDELANISKDLLSWQVEKFARQHTGKYQGDFEKSESDAKKYEAFLGGYITNAAMTLYDNGYRDAAIKQLDQAKSILEARKKLEEETQAIKTRVEEEDDAVDLTDILGLFGD